MGWDLTLRAQTTRAQTMSSVWLKEEGGVVSGLNANPRGNSRWGDVRSFGCDTNIDPILGFNLEGKKVHLSLENDETLGGQIQTTMDHDLENEVIIGEEGKKRPRGYIEESSTMREEIGECLKLLIYYRRLSRGRPTDRNENLKLERPWSGESMDSSKTSA